MITVMFRVKVMVMVTVVVKVKIMVPVVVRIKVMVTGMLRIKVKVRWLELSRALVFSQFSHNVQVKEQQSILVCVCNVSSLQTSLEC